MVKDQDKMNKIRGMDRGYLRLYQLQRSLIVGMIILIYI
jgi:hypothetical protein